MSELVVPIRFLINWVTNEATAPRFPTDLIWIHNFESFMVATRCMTFFLPLRNICFTDFHIYIPLVVVTIPSLFSLLWLVTGFITSATRRMPQLTQELRVPSNYLNSSRSIFSFLYGVLSTIVFRFVIVIFVPALLFLITPFGIFKHI
jgi:hypothetical protein